MNYNKLLSSATLHKVFFYSVFSILIVLPFPALADTATFYPSADGFPIRAVDASTFSALATGAGTAVNTSSDIVLGRLTADTTSNLWDDIIRGAIIFDTSSLPNDATITSATISLYGATDDENHGVFGTISVNVYDFTPATPNTITSSDYVNFGTTALATSKTTTAWVDNDFNVFTLNSSGIAEISLTGYSNFGFRMVNDATNTAPTWSSGGRDGARFKSVEATGTSQDPVLTVNYTVPSSSSASSVTSSSSSSLISGTGSDLFGTGSMIWGETYCGEYEIIDGSGSTLCAIWIHTVEKSALAYFYSSQVQITFSGLLYVGFIFSVLFIFLFVVCRFFFDLLTHKYAREKNLFSSRKLK